MCEVTIEVLKIIIEEIPPEVVKVIIIIIINHTPMSSIAMWSLYLKYFRRGKTIL